MRLPRMYSGRKNSYHNAEGARLKCRIKGHAGLTLYLSSSWKYPGRVDLVFDEETFNILVLTNPKGKLKVTRYHVSLAGFAREFELDAEDLVGYYTAIWLEKDRGIKVLYASRRDNNDAIGCKVTIRLSKTEKEAWQRTAERKEIGMSTYIRHCVNRNREDEGL